MLTYSRPAADAHSACGCPGGAARRGRHAGRAGGTRADGTRAGGTRAVRRAGGATGHHGASAALRALADCSVSGFAFYRYGRIRDARATL